MPVKINHPKTKAAGLALALALGIPAAAQAMPSGTEGGHRYGWLDLVVVVGFLTAICLLGIWGDLALGAVIGGIWTLAELCGRLVTTGLRVTRVPRPPTRAAQARFGRPSRGLTRGVLSKRTVEAAEPE
jgi:hypothetical protein